MAFDLIIGLSLGAGSCAALVAMWRLALRAGAVASGTAEDSKAG
jgi:hypothetical protein